jgi:hypothetical protein
MGGCVSHPPMMDGLRGIDAEGGMGGSASDPPMKNGGCAGHYRRMIKAEPSGGIAHPRFMVISASFTWRQPPCR